MARKTTTGNLGGLDKDGKGKKIILTDNDWEQAEQLAGHMWTCDEIAAFLNIGKATLYARIKEEHGCSFAEWANPFYDQFRGTLRSSMARKAVKEGDKGMMIYLSKNYLGMTDKTDIDMKGNITIKINGKFAKL